MTGRIPIAIDQPCPLHWCSNMENVWACELKYQRHQSCRDLQRAFTDSPPRNNTNTEEGILHSVVCSAVYGLPLGEWNLHNFSATKPKLLKLSVSFHSVPSLWKCPCLFVPKWAFEKRKLSALEGFVIQERGWLTPCQHITRYWWQICQLFLSVAWEEDFVQNCHQCLNTEAQKLCFVRLLVTEATEETNIYVQYVWAS